MAYIKLSNDIQRPTSSALVNIFLFELAKKLAQTTKTSKGSLLILILNFSFCFYLKKAENNSKNTKWSLLILILNFFLFVLGTAITTT